MSLPKRISGLLFGAAIFGQFTLLAAGSVFQIRLVKDQPSQDTEQLPMKSPDGQSITLPVERKPVFDAAGVASAVVVKDESTGQPVLQVRLTSVGSRQITEITRQNIHNRLAVVIDGVLYEAPVIQAEISTDFLPVRDNLTPQLADALARKINAEIRTNSGGK